MSDRIPHVNVVRCPVSRVPSTDRRAVVCHSGCVAVSVHAAVQQVATLDVSARHAKRWHVGLADASALSGGCSEHAEGHLSTCQPAPRKRVMTRSDGKVRRARHVQHSRLYHWSAVHWPRRRRIQQRRYECRRMSLRQITLAMKPLVCTDSSLKMSVRRSTAMKCWTQ